MKNLRNSRLMTLIAALALAFVVAVPVAGCSSKDTATTDAGSAAAGDEAAAITVSLHIDGTLGEEGAESDQVVTIAEGSTVLDALNASNAQVTAEESDYGPYVTIINGIAAHDSYGWVYDVNGEEIMEGADSYVLSDGDTVNWTLINFE